MYVWAYVWVHLQEISTNEVNCCSLFHMSKKINLQCVFNQHFNAHHASNALVS